MKLPYITLRFMKGLDEEQNREFIFAVGIGLKNYSTFKEYLFDIPKIYKMKGELWILHQK